MKGNALKTSHRGQKHLKRNQYTFPSFQFLQPHSLSTSGAFHRGIRHRTVLVVELHIGLVGVLRTVLVAHRIVAVELRIDLVEGRHIGLVEEHHNDPVAHRIVVVVGHRNLVVHHIHPVVVGEHGRLHLCGRTMGQWHQGEVLSTKVPR